jgi:hypothetical protein
MVHAVRIPRRGTHPVFRKGGLDPVYFLTPNAWDYCITHHRDLWAVAVVVNWAGNASLIS